MAHVLALTKLASPLSCVGVSILHFGHFSFNIPYHNVLFLCLFVLCHCSLLRARVGLISPHRTSLTAKLCRQSSCQCLASSPFFLEMGCMVVCRCLSIK